MIKSPAQIVVNYVNREGSETVGVFRTFASKGDRDLNVEYIRRDLVEKMIRVAFWSIDHAILDGQLFIDKIIAEEEIK